ncbi:MAG: hypothetical protein WCO56_22475, partial [Verrucomicrobiota bacterium]
QQKTKQKNIYTIIFTKPTSERFFASFDGGEIPGVSYPLTSFPLPWGRGWPFSGYGSGLQVACESLASGAESVCGRSVQMTFGISK